MPVIGYVRVSTIEQAASGLGLDVQDHAIREACDRRGWDLLEIVRDEGASGKDLDRPGLKRALQLLADGHATGLVVAKLDRLSRSVIDFGLLLEWTRDAGVDLLALDLGVDTSTPGGRLVANVFASVAEWERDTISRRTTDALAAARAQGRPTGRPAVADRPELADRIRALKGAGLTLREICETLNTEGIPTARGAAGWRPSAVQQILGYRRRRPQRKQGQLPAIRARRQPIPASYPGVR